MNPVSVTLHLPVVNLKLDTAICIHLRYKPTDSQTFVFCFYLPPFSLTMRGPPPLSSLQWLLGSDDGLSGYVQRWKLKIVKFGSQSPCNPQLVQNPDSIHSRSLCSWTLTLNFRAQVQVPGQVQGQVQIRSS